MRAVFISILFMPLLGWASLSLAGTASVPVINWPGQSESEDGNILLWHELKQQLQQIKKDLHSDSKRIQKLEGENNRLRADLDKLSLWRKSWSSGKNVTKANQATRRPRSVEISQERLPAEYQQVPIQDQQAVKSDRRTDGLIHRFDEQQKKVDGLIDQIRHLANRISAIDYCCHGPPFPSRRDRDVLADAIYPDQQNLDQLKLELRHATESLTQLDHGQYEIRDKQKWLVFQIEQIKSELGAVDEDRRKMWKILANSGDADRGEKLQGDSSGDLDSSGWQSVTFVDDSVIRPLPESPPSQGVEKMARDAYSIVTQLKTKLDVLEKDLSKLTGLFSNLEKSQLTQTELNAFTETIDFLQDTLANVSSRILEDDITHEKQHSQLETDLAEVTKRLRTLTLQTEKAKHLAQVVKDHQVDHFTAIQQFRQDLNALETNVLRLGVKLTTLQADILNATLVTYKDNNKDLQQDIQIAELYSRIDRMDGKFPEIHQTMKDIMASVRSKAERAEVKNIGADVQKLGEKLQLTTIFNESLQSVVEAVRTLETQLPTDCSMSSVPYRVSDRRNGTYVIKPKDSPKAIVAYCQFDEPTSNSPAGWTVIQKRSTARENFNRTWDEYRTGFGDPKQEYWLGNENIHMLTRQADCLLRIDVWDIFGDYYYAEYDSFKVASFEEGYRLDIGQYSGNLSDALQSHNGMRFSASDMDSDASSTHCARYYSSGWWFSNCQKANLNGPFPLGVIWFSSSKNDWLQLENTLMKLRPV